MRSRQNWARSRLPETVHQLDANVPPPPSDRGAWAIALGLSALGIAVLTLVLSGVIGSGASSTSAGAPPPVPAVTPTPVPGATAPTGEVTPAGSGSPHAGRTPNGLSAKAGARAIVSHPSSAEAHRDLALYEAQTSTHISERWIQGFYPIYAVAQRTFGVNWLLLASIHRQESAFSTAPGIYHGLNFAGCCGGPMQFNVSNGGVGSGGAGTPSTWDLVSDSYIYGRRPAHYHPPDP